MTNVKLIPHTGSRDIERRSTAREEIAQSCSRLVDLLTASAGAGGERLGADVAGADGLEVGGELALRGAHPVSRTGELPAGLRGAGGDLLELQDREPFDVLVERVAPDSRRARAAARAMARVAGVRVVTAAAPADHHVPAPLAAHDAGEQRGPGADAARGPRDAGLSGEPDVLVDERLVRAWVHVLTDAQLPEVHPVLEELPNPARRHLQLVREPADRGAGAAGAERALDERCALVGHQAPRLRVAPVSGRCLSALPDPRLCREAPPVLEPLGVLFALMLSDREQEVALQPAGGGRAVDLLAHDDDSAARGLHAIPGAQLLTDAATEPAEVADDDAGVLAALDPLDRREQRGALLERQAAADVELGLEHHEPAADTVSLALEVGDLVAVGVEAVAAAAAEVADPDEPGPRESVACHPEDPTRSTCLVVLGEAFTRQEEREDA